MRYVKEIKDMDLEDGLTVVAQRLTFSLLIFFTLGASTFIFFCLVVEPVSLTGYSMWIALVWLFF
jgi:hypothetical protein